MGEEYINKTKSTLGKVIKKPPLTDKLLSKPPFRFLHDIITEVIKTTGFLKGLYQSDEMNAQNVKDKDSKMTFLQKAIDVVAMVSGDSLTVRTNKIVAGHEPDKTNEFLQSLGKCILKKLSSEDEVARVLKGDKPGSAGKSKSRKDDREKSAEKKKRSNKEESEKKHSAGKEREEREKRSSKDRQKDRDNQERDREDRKRSKDKERDNDKNKEAEKERNLREKRKEAAEQEERRRRQEEEEEEAQKLDIGANDDEENEDIQPNRIPRPLSAKGFRRGPPKDLDEPEIRKSSARGSRGPKADSSEINGVLNGEEDLPPQVQASRKMARPSSARPPAPRVKGQDLADEPATRIGSGKQVANVIVDNGQSDDDDDDGGFFMEEAHQPIDTQQEDGDIEDDNHDHGGLVSKILQSKKEFEGASRTDASEKPKVMDAARRKEREMISKDIEKLRGSIQTLCRSANPLGKTLDYVQEDTDSMHKELEMWRKENKEHALAIAREQSVTESELEPLKTQLAELDQAISDQLDLISTVKHNILKNDEKVQKMIGSIAYSAR